FLIYGLLLTAQSAELLPTFSYEPDSAFYPKATPKEVLFAVLTNGIGFFITAILSSLVAEQIRKTSFKLKEKERELEQYKARFDDIVRTVQIGLITVDNDERITYINPTAERILERSLHEIRGQPIANLLPIPDGEGIDEEVEYTAPSGTRRYLAIASQVLTSSDGHREGRVVSIRDQTEIKRMQQEVMRTEKLAAIGRLTASIAHEIRNPLTSISGCIELLQQEVANGETSQHLMNIIAEEIDRLNQLISDILYLAKPPKSIESVFDISNMLYDLAYAVSTDPSCRDRIKVETELTSGLYVRGDPSQLRQMFWNIIINSVQAIRGKGRILIRSSILQNDSGRQAKVSIEDTGTGIPPDVIDSIFDPFFTTKEKGTGLGLTIAHKIVESHEGKIRVDSEPDKGTVFTITIPMVSSLQVEG
ncbi:MAG TPA: PAS domain S-box protein, partial [Proteobacteria bacterium]|nr:PAS domain S-box protein [Pseudomonadota bacterium]